MKKKNVKSFYRETISIISLLGLFALAIFLFYFSNGINMQSFFEKDIKVATRQVNVAFLPESEFQGWIAWWDEKNSYQSLVKNKNKLKAISPVWYSIDEQARLITIPHTLETEIKVLAQDSKISLVPAITNAFEPRRTGYLLNNKDVSDKLIDDLIRLAKDSGFSGFDLDFEEIDPRDQPLYERFIAELSEKMHKEDLIVAVSVHARTGTENDREVAKAVNLERLAESADFIKVMAYDFHSQNSVSGPITPMKELTQVLDFTSTRVPSKKIILGLPVYGYDWNVTTGSPAQVLTYQETLDKLASESGILTRDKDSQSLLAKYKKDGESHEIWFEDKQTIDAMIKEARKFGIYQFSFWRIGAEDPEIW